MGLRKDLLNYAKMLSWHLNKKYQIVESLSDKSLEIFYKICCEKGYALEANKLHSELILRNIEIDPIEFGEDPDLKPEQLCQYIDEHISECGRYKGENLIAIENEDKSIIAYSWGPTDLFEEEMYDCVIDFNNKTVEFGSIVLNFDNMREIIANINEELFG